MLPRDFPGSTFAFLPADIVSQILNFGAPAPIDVQVAGPDTARQRGLCHRAAAQASRPIPGVADVRLQQSSHYPELDVDVDRTRAGQLGHHRARRDQQPGRPRWPAASRSRPTFWLNPQERRVLSDRRPDPAVRRRLAGRA